MWPQLTKHEYLVGRSKQCGWHHQVIYKSLRCTRHHHQVTERPQKLLKGVLEWALGVSWVVLRKPLASKWAKF